MSKVDDQPASVTDLARRLDDLERRAIADRDRIDTLQHDLDTCTKTVEHLEVALGTARRIGAAIGIVMAARKYTEQGAFDLLARISQHQNRKVGAVADEVVETGAVPD